VDVLFATITAVMELIPASRVHALAVTAPARWPALPDVPTVGEFVAGYELASWAGIGARRHAGRDYRSAQWRDQRWACNGHLQARRPS